MQKIIFLILTFIISNTLFALTQVNLSSHQPEENYLVLADIHFDPFSACQGKSPCAYIQKLSHASANEWAKILQTYDAQLPQYKQDTNYKLLITTLSFANQIANQKNVKSILVLGDFIGHDYRKHYIKFSLDKTSSGYQAFVKKSLQFLTLELNRAFPTQDIFSVMGNNDSDIRDYFIQQSGNFFLEVADLLSPLIKHENARNKFYKQFPIGGYYSLNLPQQPKVRLIVLNSLLFSNKVKGRNMPMTAAQALSWLEHELQTVKNNHQKTFIIMHIPPSMDFYATPRMRLFTLFKFWQSHYVRHFQSLVENYSNEISGIFTAHIHSDGFNILTFKNSHNEIPVFSVPSVSPIFGNNPSFKIYSFATNVFRTRNITYYFLLADKKTWQMEYQSVHLHIKPYKKYFSHHFFV